ncbi:MAG: Trk family potassium uptake protein [Lachnospiraceae bacterium]|nr:Trk family potassium uptake protein [Lachnospiraceae bacterium]
MTTFRIIFLGFLGIILAGTLLLMLPFASNGPGHAKFSEALFTAVSATCVTGLIVQDTATYWSVFGKCIIIIMIQIGGMGVITVAIAMSLVFKRKIGLAERSLMQESISAFQLGGIVRMTTFILKVILAIEGIGAIAIMPVFIPRFGVLKGILYSFFHSISAFCNAGFDLMGEEEKFSSMVHFQGNVLLNVVLMILILVGGIGFKTWEDVGKYKFKLKHYSMQSKMVLSLSLVLIVIPAIYFFFGEYAGFPVKERVLSTMFQTIAPRTAGFNTSDLAAFSDTGKFVMIILMLIGGSSGSTAGGMKMTTICVLIASLKAVFTQKSEVTAFGRRIGNDAVIKAGVIFMVYNFLFVLAGCIISRLEGIPILDCLFETASAIATVGLTVGITSSLGLASRIIIMILMFLGRVGGLTVVFAVLSDRRGNMGRLPEEKISVG